MKLRKKRLPTKVIFRMAVPWNARGSFRTMSNSSKKFIIDFEKNRMPLKWLICIITKEFY